MFFHSNSTRFDQIQDDSSFDLNAMANEEKDSSSDEEQKPSGSRKSDKPPPKEKKRSWLDRILHIKKKKTQSHVPPKPSSSKPPSDKNVAHSIVNIGPPKKKEDSTRTAFPIVPTQSAVAIQPLHDAAKTRKPNAPGQTIFEQVQRMKPAKSKLREHKPKDSDRSTTVSAPQQSNDDDGYFRLPSQERPKIFVATSQSQGQPTVSTPMASTPASNASTVRSNTKTTVASEPTLAAIHEGYVEEFDLAMYAGKPEIILF